MEIQRDEIRERDQKYELLLKDFKKLGLENWKLKKDQKARLASQARELRSRRIRRPRIFRKK